MSDPTPVENEKLELVVESALPNSQPHLLFSVYDIDDINQLLVDLSSTGKPGRQYCNLMEIARQVVNHGLVIVRIQEKLVGMGTLCIKTTLTGTRGEIEDVVVSASHQRKGIGTKITNRLIDMGRELALPYLDLHTSRADARAMYAKIGFKQTKEDRSSEVLRYRYM